MLPKEGNSNTACFLFPSFQVEIKPPAMRVVVDFRICGEFMQTVDAQSCLLAIRRAQAGRRF